MKILVLTNLYPPHHAGTFDNHCQTVTESLRLRGHSILVLTSSYGLRGEQRDNQVDRRLRLNGAFGQPAIANVMELRPLEIHNNQVLSETIDQFQPDVIHVFSLAGLSKSLVFTLYNSKRAVVYDIYDHWLSATVREDPWLRFWNAPGLPFLEQSKRKALEMSGERIRLDSIAPTRLMRGYDRVPAIFGEGKDLAAVQPNSIAAFRFDRLYFCSQTLKQLTETVGFCVNHGEVIYPGITAAYIGDIKPPGVPMKKYLIVARLTEESGVLTALQAVKIARNAGLDINLSIYGKGESAYMAELRSFVVSNQLPVEFLNVSNQITDLAAVYKRHDVLVHTPEWAEPFPFTALEAMACGMPVIGSRVGGMEELLRHGENSLTYASGDPQELALRIQELQISPALRCQMAETAQADVLGRFNDATAIDQVENFLLQSQAQTS